MTATIHEDRAVVAIHRASTGPWLGAKRQPVIASTAYKATNAMDRRSSGCRRRRFGRGVTMGLLF